MLCACGVDFRPLRANQTHHSRECQKTFTNNTARAERRAAAAPFTLIDGEGLNLPDGRHVYAMLSVGDSTIYNPNGLDHEQIFEHLYLSYLAEPYTVYAGFSLRYDFTQWLKSVDEESARSLFNPDERTRYHKHGRIITPVTIDDEWQIDLIGMKRFKLRPVRDKAAQWMYINDVFGYWQTSLLGVLNPARWPVPVVTEYEYADLLAGKEARADIITDTRRDSVTITTMEHYNHLENIAAARAMEELARGYLSVGVKPSRDSWYGPGSAAQAWLDTLDTPSPLRRVDVQQSGDPDPRGLDFLKAWEWATASYYGGRFEPFMHGHIPGITYEYDLQSAYPDAIRHLPCLCRGVTTDETWAPVTFVYITARGTDPVMGGLPWRDKDGTIVFPHEVIGWYPVEEVSAAIKAGLIDNVDIRQSFGIVPCEHEPPLAIMADLFELRLRVGKNTAQGKAIKLLLNSVYGKFAQSVGTAKYGNPFYASLITSGCRTKIIDAIGSHPMGTSDLVMVATDGVFFRTPHPTLPLTPNTLGEWELTEKHNLTVFKAGMYWDDETRAGIARQDVTKVKSRGVSGAVFANAIADLDQAFTDMTCEEELPSTVQTLGFSYIGPEQALQRNKWDRCGLVRYDETRTDTARLAPKRHTLRRDGDVWRSSPGVVKQARSFPYRRDFGGYLV